MKYSLGVDFDNTLVSYDEPIYKKALESGLISPETQRNKKVIRDLIRQKPDGDIEWQKIQAFVYGEGIREAKLIDGVKDFFDQCRALGIDVRVVSHKTEFASMDNEGVNLRTAALNWMSQNKLFGRNGLGLFGEDIFFESTRQGKIDRIKGLKCTHFIDDLEETFQESSFPADVQKILYAPGGGDNLLTDVKSCGTWEEINDYIFKNGR